MTIEDTLPPGAMLGDYRVEKKIGEGGMSTVYSAVHPIIGKRAAVKVIKADILRHAAGVERFLQEAQAVNRIGHPNIVDVFAFGTLPDGRCYMIMEGLQGETLADRLARGPMPLGDVLAILSQVVDALEAVHENGLVHRDLKPPNIFLQKVSGGRALVKLLDFGIAKLLDSEHGSADLTTTGMLIGTPAYFAPEQAERRQIDGRADIYTLGVVAFEAILGQRPFDGDTPIDIVSKHIQVMPPEPRSVWPEIPDALNDILLRMLAKDPERRPSLLEVREIFVGLIKSNTPTLTPRSVTPFTLTPVPAKPRTTIRRWAVLGIVVLVAAGAVTTWRLRTSPRVAAEHPAAEVAPVERAPPAAPPPASVAPAPAPAPPPVPEPPPVAAGATPRSDPEPAAVARPAAAGRAATTKGSGFLTVNARPWVRVAVDGQWVADETPLRRFRLSVGKHSVRFVNVVSGFDQHRSITVRANGETKVFVDIPQGAIGIE